MSRPLQPRPETKANSARWHREIFSMWGDRCFFCNAKASDAAHILKRSKIGSKHAYASPRLGRSLCRKCHTKQEVGELQFPLYVRIDATLAINEFTKVPHMVPTE